MLQPVTSTETEKIEEENPGIFPLCAVIWAKPRKEKFCGVKDETIDPKLKNPDMDFNCSSLVRENSIDFAFDVSLSRRQLVIAQERDPESIPLFS